MKVFVTGATGFIGSALCLALRRHGHEVVAYVRNPGAARSSLGAEIELCPTSVDDVELSAVLGGCQGVINLAGAPVAQRWTEARKAAIEGSRIGLTERLVRAAASAEQPPQHFVSASAVGIYGDRGDETLDASSTAGGDWLAGVTERWESAARGAAEFGARVAIVRIGLVLGREGGMLAKMVPAFLAGVGGRLGSGRQWMPWIHLDDVVELFIRALEDERFEGVFEGAAPNAVRNTDFTRALGAKLGRPTLVPVPAFALRVLFGGAGRVIVAGQRVHPKRTLEAGFRFRYERLAEALEDVLGPHGVDIAPAEALPDHPYLEERGATHRLEQHTWIDAPLSEVFPLFERAENLGPLTPPALAFDTQTPGPLHTRKGAVIEHRIRLGPVPMTWITEILDYQQDRGFVDAQMRGPYRSWYHEHWFEADGERTRMVDRVHYKVPFGPLGRLVNRLFVAPQLRRIFAFRATAIRSRFGVVEGSSPVSARVRGADDLDAASAAE